MIVSHDRSGYIGASDVQYVIGNWKTKTWEKWWMQKIGINTDHFNNKYTLAGTHFEHRILDHLGIPNLEKDKQIIIEELRLRVNLDGNTLDRIKEVKTYQWSKGFKVPPKYINQTHVQVFSSFLVGMAIDGADIVAYGLEEEDYNNFFRDIDSMRLQEIPIEYSPKWIETVYLPKHLILSRCLEKGEFPDV